MTLETLVSQPEFPYDAFLDDMRQYDQSKRFWQNAFEEGLIFPTAKSDWTDWMNNPFHDGLPIWSVINERAWLGMVVQQVARSDDPVWFKCWLSHADIGRTKSLPYLFVETSISQSAYRAFVGLVREWTAENTSIAHLMKITQKAQQRAIANRPSLGER